MLSQEQLDHFHTNGYLVVENVIDEASLKAVRAEYSDRMDMLYANWEAAGLVKHAHDGMSFWEKLDQCYKGEFDWYQPFDISLPHDGITEETQMHFGPAIFNIVKHKNILDIMEQLLGQELTSNPIQHVRIKPPEYAVPKDETRAHIVSTDWHQDKGVTLPEADDTQMVTIWLAITDATIENGCLQIANRKVTEMLPHCLKTQVTIPDQFVDKANGIPVPVKAGGAVLFHPYTPHSSLANTTEHYRWSFDLRYNVTGQPTGRSQFPEFIARSKAHPESELTDWREWKAMWERARYNEANVEHLSQHRWGNDAPYCA